MLLLAALISDMCINKNLKFNKIKKEWVGDTWFCSRIVNQKAFSELYKYVIEIVNVLLNIYFRKTLLKIYQLKYSQHLIIILQVHQEGNFRIRRKFLNIECDWGNRVWQLCNWLHWLNFESFLPRLIQSLPVDPPPEELTR